jgi:hypothetical protein
MFGKATRRPWRDKPGKDQIKSRIRTATAPRQCISVDQLESTTPGLIAQLKGWLTTKRYKVATVFVDHFSDPTYVYLQKSTSSDETLEAKLSFERLAAKSGVKILRYQADNGRFTDTKFRMHAQKCNQLLTFCGVNAHFQNGVAERKIRALQDQARTMTIYAQSRWPEAVTANLWPYTVRLMKC